MSASDSCAPLRRRFESHDPAATMALAETLGRHAQRGAVIALEGEMGSGKTTFVRGLARGLGVAPDEVSSPTYTLMHEHRGRLPLYHFDAWMSAREGAFLAGGAEDLLGGDGVAVIEWAGEVAEFLPRPRLAVRLSHTAASVRQIDLRWLPAAADASPASDPDEHRAAASLEGGLVAGMAAIEPAPQLLELTQTRPDGALGHQIDPDSSEPPAGGCVGTDP